MKTGYRTAGAGLALCLGLALGGCSDVLDVELPADLTGDALNDPVGASTQINSTIVLFENAMSRFQYIIHGHEDGGEIVLMSPSIGSGEFGYPATVTSTEYANFMQSRRFATDLHQKLDKSWTVAQVPKRAQYLAITSIYEGATYAWMAATLCEGSLDAGKLMSQAELYSLADATLTRAINEVGTAGDFAMPFGIASSALSMAYGLRAQNYWMSGDLAKAKADAEKVTGTGATPTKFTAFYTRENTATRRNLPYYNGPSAKFASMQGIVDWWQSSLRQANPATGQKWPEVIPFTGYTELGILPDGRAVRDDGLPIRRPGVNIAGAGIEQKYRTAIEDTSVPDTRVPFTIGLIGGKSTQTYIATKYSADSQFQPLVNWKEMVLIRAEATGGQGAIDLVNQIRTADKLPTITYLAAGDTEGIRRMLIEERRRALFQEGRYYYSKLKNLDLLWFPRNEGRMPTAGINYQGGVRLAMPVEEYQVNSNIADLNKRGTGCDAKSRPIF